MPGIPGSKCHHPGPNGPPHSVAGAVRPRNATPHLPQRPAHRHHAAEIVLPSSHPNGASECSHGWSEAAAQRRPRGTRGRPAFPPPVRPEAGEGSSGFAVANRHMTVNPFPYHLPCTQRQLNLRDPPQSFSRQELHLNCTDTRGTRHLRHRASSCNGRMEVEDREALLPDSFQVHLERGNADSSQPPP
jgi:hypothetical protein